MISVFLLRLVLRPNTWSVTGEYSMYTWDLRKMCFLWLLDWIFGLNKSFKCICVFKITLLTNVVKGTWVLKESNTFMIYDKKKKTILFSTSVPVPQFNYFICFIVFTTEFSFFFLPIIFISWRLITLQHCSGFCHTSTWISHGFTCVPHPDPPSRLPPHPIPLGLPSAPAPSTCLMHPTWTGDLFHTW